MPTHDASFYIAEAIAAVAFLTWCACVIILCGALA